MLPDFRVRQRDFLLEISRAITGQLDLSEVLRRVLNASVIMLSGQAGLIALRSSDHLYYVRAITGIDSEMIPVLNRHLHELSTIVNAGNDPEAFYTRLKVMAAKIDRTLQHPVALPMIFAEEPLGWMFVFRRFSSNATPNDLQILQSFADQAAIAVNNAQLYERINQERQRLASIVEYSADGVMILSADLEILSFNRALERMTGWNADEAIGAFQDDVIIWQFREGSDLLAVIEQDWTNAPETHLPLYVQGEILRKDDLSLSIGITYAPHFNSDELLENIIANVRDITNFRKAQELQNTFISIISHELKTPVAIIKGYAATLQRPDATWNSAVIQETMAVIEDEADRLNALIQNLLTASKLQAEDRLSLDLGPVLLPALAQRAVERLSGQSSKHTFRTHFPEDFPIVNGDQTKLLQVLDNLIGNAIKYSPEGGTIETGGYVDDQTVTVYVRDEGVGLTPNEQDRVFDRFYRVDSTLSSKTQGTGLGLFLSKAIIEAHDGSIHVDSKPGKGATFYFIIPQKLHQELE